MNKKEALMIVQKQLKDYNRWSSVVLSSLISKSDKCLHPYPMWTNKHDDPGNCSCMVCGKRLKPSEIHESWHWFDNSERVGEAIEVLKKELLDK